MGLKDFGPMVVKKIQSRDIAIGIFCELDNGQGIKFFCANCSREILAQEFPGAGDIRPFTDEEFETEYRDLVKEIENLDVSGESPERQAILAELKKSACTDIYVPFKIPSHYKNLFTEDEIDRRNFAYIKSDSKIICSKCKAVCM